MAKDRCKINHLLFMDDLKLFAKSEKELESSMQTVRIGSDDIGMKFGLDKCASMTTKRGKRVHLDCVCLLDGSQVKVLVETGYKYFGVLESEDVLYRECKESLRCQYVRRAKKCLKSKLNGANMIKVINIRS